MSAPVLSAFHDTFLNAVPILIGLITIGMIHKWRNR